MRAARRLQGADGAALLVLRDDTVECACAVGDVARDAWPTPAWIRRVVNAGPEGAALGDDVAGGRSGYAVPLPGRAEPAGVLLVVGRAATTFDAELLADLAAWARRELEAASDPGQRLFFADNPQPMWIYDRETLRFLAVNDAALRQYGYTRAEFLALTLPDIRPPEDVDALWRNLATSSPGHETSGPWQHQRKDGSRLYVQIESQATRYAGRHARLVVATDITESLQIRQALADSEARHRAIVQALPDVIFRLDRDGRYRDVEAHDESMLVRPRAELLRACIPEVLPPEAAAVWMDTIHRVLDTGEPDSVEYDLVTLDDTRHYFEARVVPVTDDEVQVVVRDVTRWRAAEAALRASEARYRLMADHVTDVIQRETLSGRILYVSPSCRALLGYAPRELVGRHVQELLHADDGYDREADARLLQQEDGSVRAHRLRRSDGSFVWVESRGRTMHDPVSDTTEVITVIRDVSERRRYEQELLAAKNRAEEMSRLKSTFLANMSHEIRTPLTAILGFADVLYDAVEPHNRRFVEVVRSGGRRLMETLNSVLDLAQLESKSLKLRPVSTDLCALARETLQLFAARAAVQRTELRCETPEAPVTIIVDHGALHRVLVNLLANAVKFTEDGRVTLRVDADGDRVRLSVSDTGVGIAPEFVPHLFEAFQQESSGLGRRYEGSGLGLAITRQLVELMRGTIEVESRLGEGSAFRVTLPAAPAA